LSKFRQFVTFQAVAIRTQKIRRFPRFERSVVNTLDAGGRINMQNWRLLIERAGEDVGCRPDTGGRPLGLCRPNKVGGYLGNRIGSRFSTMAV
jgi:hypothetical protein